MNKHQSSEAERTKDAIAAHIIFSLQGSIDQIPHDITERLRVARSKAVFYRKSEIFNAGINSRAHQSAVIIAGAQLRRWRHLITLTGITALITCLIFINIQQSNLRINELADIDSALLTDDLPPSAYMDPGFMHFLRSTSE